MSKVFVYGMRDFDELPFFEKFTREMGMELAYTAEYPSPDNWHYTKGCDAVNILTTETGPDMMDALQANGVKCIVTRTIGYDHVDVNYAHKIGMGVGAITYSPATVADYTIMLMLIACRKLKYIMAKGDVQDYRLGTAKLGRELRSCTVGVIGTGRIGKTVIRQLSGWGCKILANDVYESDEVKQYAEYVDLETLYANSDIITLHAPAMESTYHMLNAETFAQMKDGVIIINCARGQLIDTQALIDALNSGKVGYACLDVIEKELGVYYRDLSGQILDNPEMHVLKGMHNVYFSPHMAFYTDEAVSNMAENSLIAIKAYLNGEDSPFIIKKK
mgnify:CR=1 FL=1